MKDFIREMIRSKSTVFFIALIVYSILDLVSTVDVISTDAQLISFGIFFLISAVEYLPLTVYEVLNETIENIYMTVAVDEEDDEEDDE